MSGRIRSLKPEWLDDEKLGLAGDAARVLSAGLILVADDYGRGRAALGLIAAEVWPYDMERDPRETLAKATRALQALAAIGYIRLYKVRGEGYFAIVNWAKHQKVDRPGKPHVPEPPEWQAEDSRECRESVATDHDHDLRPQTSDLGTGTFLLGETSALQTSTPIPLSTFAAYLTETWPNGWARSKPPSSWEAVWGESCPAVDLIAEARRARAWQLEDLTRRQRPQPAKFLGNWFREAQARASRVVVGRGAPPKLATAPASTQEDFDRDPRRL